MTTSAINPVSKSLVRNRTSKVALISLSMLAAVASPDASQAQSAGLPPQSDIARQRLEPAPAPTLNEDYNLTIQNPERSAVARSVDEVEFSVQKIAVQGAEHLDTEQVRAIFAPLEGQTIRLPQLREAAIRLETIYHDRGWFLARVFIPPQRVVEGMLEVRVVEGYIGSALVTAPNRASERLGDLALASVVGKTMPTLSDLENPLQRLNDVPGLSASGVLRPGATLGSTEMLIVLARPAASLRAVVSNTSSRELGPMTYGLAATVAQPFGRPGSLDLFALAAGEGLRELQSGGFRLAMPVNNGRLVLSLGGLIARGRPGGLIGSLAIHSGLESLNIRLSGSLFPQRMLRLHWEAGLTMTRSRVDALGDLLSYDRSTVAELSLTAERREWLGGDLSVTISLARGLTVLGANSADARLSSVAGFNPQFTRFAWSARRVQRLTGKLSATVEVQGQVTGSTLVSGEQIGFGGATIGRAFDPSVASGDRGIGGIGELQLALPVLSYGPLSGVQVYAFTDYARVVQARNGAGLSIGSIGGGLRFDLFRHTALDMQLARAVLGTSLAGDRSTRFNVTAMLRF